MVESRCGLLCSNCKFFAEDKCKGCTEIANPFWGECKVKGCCEEKSQEHCGKCTQFPCEQLHEFAYAEQEGDNGIRLDQCKIWNVSEFMKYAWIDAYLMEKPGVNKLPPQWNWIRYAIGGKMFAAVCLGETNKPYYITLKLEPTEGDFLRQQYEDIIPGYYMNKKHWNSVKADGEVSDKLLKDLLDKSYQLVLGSFSKKKQQEILGMEKIGE